MVEIHYGPGTLEVRGHAGAGARGQDVVCAGVSALVCTLAEYVRARGGRAELASGRAVLRWPEECGGVAEAFLAGLERIAEQYPEYVGVGRGETLGGRR